MNTTVAVRLSLLAGIVLLVVAATGGTALGQSDAATASGSPDINVYVPDKEVTPGTTTEFLVQLDNQGESHVEKRPIANSSQLRGASSSH